MNSSNLIASDTLTVSGATLDLATDSDSVAWRDARFGNILGTTGVLTMPVRSCSTAARSSPTSSCAGVCNKSTAGAVTLSAATFMPGPGHETGAGTLTLGNVAAPGYGRPQHDWRFARPQWQFDYRYQLERHGRNDHGQQRHGRDEHADRQSIDDHDIRGTLADGATPLLHWPSAAAH